MKPLTKHSTNEQIENFVQYATDNSGIIAFKNGMCGDVFLLRREFSTDMATSYFFNLKYQGMAWDRRSAPTRQEATVATIKATFANKESENVKIHCLGNENHFAEWIFDCGE